MRRVCVVSICAVVGMGAALVPSVSASAAAGDTLVNVGSPPTTFLQNKQNEPAVAVDANNPSILAAGSNDEIDLEACNAGDPTACTVTAGVGLSGIFRISGSMFPKTALMPPIGCWRTTLSWPARKHRLPPRSGCRWT